MGRYWHTLRYLRPVQVYGRIGHRLVTPRVDNGPAPALRERSGTWVEPAQHQPSLVGPDRFTFLGEEHSLQAVGWDDPGIGKLWRYNLHYFDHLAAPASQDQREWQRALLLRWVRENPPARGSGWEPYPTSLRIVNWIKWSLAGNELPAECVHSLAVQARWLSKRLETFFLANHLFVNLKALVFAGSYFDGPEAGSWLSTGTALLRREVPEQMLGDGGHFELTPMYHSLLLEDMLDLVNVCAAFSGSLPDETNAVAATWRDVVPRMLHWQAAMSHPDGRIAFFNDAAFDIAPEPDVLTAYGSRLGLVASARPARGVTHLSDSGFVRVEAGAATALLDVARVGADYNPAHAHADTLSFELSLFEQRVFVNSGTSCYGTGPERLRQRSTAAHNTVVVNGENSSEVWSGFRVARRARPVDLAIHEGRAPGVRCAHDGYRRLPGQPVHHRTWSFSATSMTVEDRVTGTFMTADARFHLHPDVVIEHDTSPAEGAESFGLRLPAGERIDVTVGGGRCRIEPSTWHPRFGTAIPSQCLVVSLSGTGSRVLISWGAATP